MEGEDLETKLYKIFKFMYLVFAMWSLNPETVNNTYEPWLIEEPQVVERRVISNYRDRILQLASRGDINAVKMEVTAYTEAPDECGKDVNDPWSGITASGKRVAKGMCATGPNIPFGTKIYIEGYGIVIAEDRGGMIHERAIDIYMTTKKEAFLFGRQFRKVYILPKDFKIEEELV
jgi:3D (Asp-Asp-Asp) domain-containing protein